MFICHPGKIPPGKVSEAAVVSTDLYPTFLDIAGLPLRPENHIDGFSFADILEGKDYTRPKPIFWHSPLARPYSTGDYNCSAVRDGRYKLIEWYQNDKVELFDIQADIGENNDLSKTLPEIKDKLLKELHKWKKEVKAAEKPLRLTKNKKTEH